MADIAGDIEGGEVVIGLGLIMVIGYFLYQFSQSACSAINSLFGLSNTCGPSANTAATAPAGYGGSYTNAANQVVTDPLTSLETILGFNQTSTPGASSPPLVGSAVVSAQTNPGTGAGFSGGGGGAF